MITMLILCLFYQDTIEVNFIGDFPEIVKMLREEEKTGLLYCVAENMTSQSEIDEKHQKDSPGDSVVFVEKDDTKVSDSDSFDVSIGNVINKLKKEIERLNNENRELLEKVKKSDDRYNSLAEYFEVISDTTMALGEKDLFSDVTDVIFQSSPSGRISYVNSAIEKIAGYSSSEIIGENLSRIIPKKDWKKIRKSIFPRFHETDVINKEINSFETFITSKNGDLIPVEISGKLIRFNVEVMGKKNEFRFQGSIKDITERKKVDEERKRYAEKLQAMNEELQKTQEELCALNEELEEKIKERTNEVEKLLRAKDDFIGQLGHDLKSPLTPLIGLLPLVEEEEKDPKLKELIGVSIRNVKYMRDLVVKTLQLERLNSPNTVFNIEEVDLAELVDLIIDTRQLIFKEEEIVVKNNIKKKLIVQGDRLQLNEIFDNLLTNAAKFTQKGGNVIIDAEKEKEKVIISVKDTGIGMTQHQIDHVFEEFYKVDPARHDLESSGLGLSICKRIAEKHGGKIWAESPGLNKGTTFKFSLPYNQKKRCCNKKEKYGS